MVRCDDEFDELRYGLVVQVLLVRNKYINEEGQQQKGLTRISITKMIVENWDKGTPRVSTVVLAGQSQISSGITVLICQLC